MVRRAAAAGSIPFMTAKRRRRDGYVDRDGVRLHWLEWSDVGRAVVCLPGITANAYAFTGLASRLLAAYRVLAVDLRGRGESDAPTAGYDVETHAGDISAVLDALRIDRVDLVGWSLGGKVALALAAAESRRVRRLVMLDPPVSTSAAARAALRAFWARLDRTYRTIEDYLEVTRGAASQLGGWSATVEAYLRADVRADPDGTVRHRVPRWVPERELDAEARTPTLGLMPVFTLSDRTSRMHTGVLSLPVPAVVGTATIGMSGASGARPAPIGGFR
jgi:pimeloyl-ACP methyl ester carboxylesterase